MEMPTFVADVHLGKLAKALRLLGFDTLYSNAYTPAQLLALAQAERRILLSRSVAFRKQAGIQAVVIKSENPDEQLQQVVQQFALREGLHPFTRCLVCNGLLKKAKKESVATQLLPNTQQYFSEFWQCTACHRIYWKGSHYDRMLALVQKVNASITQQ